MLRIQQKIHKQQNLLQSLIWQVGNPFQQRLLNARDSHIYRSCSKLALRPHFNVIV